MMWPAFWLMLAITCCFGTAICLLSLLLDKFDRMNGRPGFIPQKGDEVYVDVVSPLGDAEGVIRIPWDIAPHFTVPWGSRVDTPWGSVIYAEEETSP